MATISICKFGFSVQVSRHHDGEHSEKEEQSPVPGIFEGSISDFPQCMQKVSSKLKFLVFVNQNSNLLICREFWKMNQNILWNQD